MDNKPANLFQNGSAILHSHKKEFQLLSILSAPDSASISFFLFFFLSPVGVSHLICISQMVNDIDAVLYAYVNHSSSLMKDLFQSFETCVVSGIYSVFCLYYHFIHCSFYKLKRKLC